MAFIQNGGVEKGNAFVPGFPDGLHQFIGHLMHYFVFVAEGDVPAQARACLHAGF